MAKMFYTLDEAAKKLNKSPDQVKAMAESGQLQEFRDRDKLMFKVEQIDLLVGGDEGIHIDQEIGDLGLDASAGASGSALGLVDSREDTGISVFDTEHGEAGADAGDTQVTDSIEDELSLESVGSGSGLLDLTRESDDTSLGAELLEEVYSGDENLDVPAHASGLFESAGAESPGNAIGAAPISATPMLVEAYDGGWSGMGVGLMMGALGCLIAVGLMIAVAINGATPALATQMAGNLWMWLGIFGGATLLLGIIGFFIGKASE
ncbi:MAG: helix-turn-helix domain-containing protein [Phycisphaerales bacterium]